MTCFIDISTIRFINNNNKKRDAIELTNQDLGREFRKKKFFFKFSFVNAKLKIFRCILLVSILWTKIRWLTILIQDYSDQKRNIIFPLKKQWLTSAKWIQEGMIKEIIKRKPKKKYKKKKTLKEDIRRVYSTTSKGECENLIFFMTFCNHCRSILNLI